MWPASSTTTFNSLPSNEGCGPSVSPPTAPALPLPSNEGCELKSIQTAGTETQRPADRSVEGGRDGWIGDVRLGDDDGSVPLRATTNEVGRTREGRASEGWTEQARGGRTGEERTDRRGEDGQARGGRANEGRADDNGGDDGRRAAIDDGRMAYHLQPQTARELWWMRRWARVRGVRARRVWASEEKGNRHPPILPSLVHPPFAIVSFPHYRPLPLLAFPTFDGKERTWNMVAAAMTPDQSPDIEAARVARVAAWG
ncbi:hypothetical protein BDN70DRAFT_921082 [Pholiota conissans]|uniref:Uncharacterized protein n=1 Tax=Pholiota conissans TaxID=109636 RepID=A0A9P6CTQ5_9AGAR|nr:hypothetical protein BDN70DRAFT_921082 [Pholiota conissans]